MLEVRILKITHLGESEAKKLLPYIQNSDVYAPERTGQTAENAAAREKWWSRVITSEMSRTKFKNSITVVSTGANQSASQAELEFLYKQYEYLFLSKVPIYFLERFSGQESEEIVKLNGDSQRLLSIGMGAIMLGEMQGTQWAYEAIKMWEILHQRRDKEMARNLKDSEAIIRETYQQLAGKPLLRFTIPVGGYHGPERYINFPVAVYELRRPPSIEDTIYDEARDLIISEQPLDKVAPVLVRLAEYKAPKNLAQIRGMIEAQKNQPKKFPF